jgi:Cu/Ag efflux pump CusA
MPSFFIDRPIFAWVIALFVCLIGAISIPLLPVAQYPIIAPPSISISTSYPGASPENLYNSVTRLIEEELNGASGILNFESTSDSLGQVEITASFVPGTDLDDASVVVQNRIKRVEPRLPRAVMQQGILIEEASSAVAARVMDFYRTRIEARSRQGGAATLARESEDAERKMRLAAVKAERTVIFRMLRSEQIGSQTADKLVHELDLLEARYEAPSNLRRT